MLELRTAKLPHDSFVSEGEANVVRGLREDVDYTIEWTPHSVGVRIYVDDVEVTPESDGRYHWRPAFYAGRVPVDLVRSNGEEHRYWLDVGPSPSKSGDECFSEMLREIRNFDPNLLIGDAAAGMVFGREGRSGLFGDNILLARLRAYGPSFLRAVAEIAKVPHRSISPDTHHLPLARVRRLHPGALRDRRVVAVAYGNSEAAQDLDSVQVRSLTVTPTFDTPANRALLALLKRMLAATRRLQVVVANCALAGDREEQGVRRHRRLADLTSLAARIAVVLKAHPFSEVTSSQTSAAGLTQIAAQPLYSRAYRAGCNALALGVGGEERTDLLHVSPSWGVYETWCYLGVLRATAEVCGSPAKPCRQMLLSSQLAHQFDLPGDQVLYAFFQATFSSGCVEKGSRGYSISRERRPDIVLVHSCSGFSRTLVLDAKWRSGRDNVLQAMESVHIYHDALRFDARRPEPCLILLPGPGAVASLEGAEFVQQHGVGALSQFAVGLGGEKMLGNLIWSWLKTAPLS